MAKVYTRTGDKGTTGLYTGERVGKDSPRVEAYGSIDELNSALGLSRAFARRPDVKETVYDLQKLLMSMMADVASLNAKSHNITQEHVLLLETTIDQYDALLKPLSKFIIPGDTHGAAALDIARTTARRAERHLLRLNREEAINDHVLVAMNRISDLCFILARVEAEIE